MSDVKKSPSAAKNEVSEVELIGRSSGTITPAELTDDLPENRDENSVLFSLASLNAPSENVESAESVSEESISAESVSDDIFWDSEIDAFVESGLVEMDIKTGVETDVYTVSKEASQIKQVVPESNPPGAESSRSDSSLSSEKEVTAPATAGGRGVRRKSLEVTMATETNWIKLGEMWTCIETGEQCGSVFDTWTAAWCPTGSRWTCLRTGEQREKLDVIGDGEWLQTGAKMTHVRTGLQLVLSDDSQWRHTGNCWTHIATGEQLDTLPEEIAYILDIRLIDSFIAHLSALALSGRLPWENGEKAVDVLKMLSSLRSEIEIAEMPTLPTDSELTTGAEKKSNFPARLDLAARPLGRQFAPHHPIKKKPRKSTMLGVRPMPVVNNEAILVKPAISDGVTTESIFDDDKGLLDIRQVAQQQREIDEKRTTLATEDDLEEPVTKEDDLGEDNEELEGPVIEEDDLGEDNKGLDEVVIDDDDSSEMVVDDYDFNVLRKVVEDSDELVKIDDDHDEQGLAGVIEYVEEK